MFVKLEFETSMLILNVDCISSIHYNKPFEREDYKYNGGYYLLTVNGNKYDITKDHYEQLCNILTKKI